LIESSTLLSSGAEIFRRPRLGLGHLQALVELHGGRIEAHSSEPATGASFVVTLPCFAQAKSEGSTISVAPASLGAMRILIVDDHFDTVESLRLLLAQDGHEVRVAATVGRPSRSLKPSTFLSRILACRTVPAPSCWKASIAKWGESFLRLP
jgi:hypothetical protein